MRYAETGVYLEVDLTRGNIEAEASDPRSVEQFLGGHGTNTKILWDRVPPETEPLSPDNILVFGTGLLTGTPALSASRTVVSSFSPQTLLSSFSIFGGFWGPELKQAGYDKVIVSGRSPEWVYLWINDGKAELRDASHLVGKGAQKTAELIKQELKEPRAQVAAIGQAGENRVYFASIEHDKSSAARMGHGAIMGDKRLKAIAVRGTGDINIARPAEYFKLCDEAMKYAAWRDQNHPKGFMPWFTPVGMQELRVHDESFHMMNFSWGNARVRKKDFWNKELEAEWGKVQDSRVERFIGCYNCPFKCGGIVLHDKVKRYAMKCFSKLTYTMGAYSDLEFGFNIAGIAQEYGVDGYSAPQVMAFAIELYEASILTDQDMPGFPSTGEERFYWLLDKIVHREGIGDILADGVYWAARKIGKGAEEFDHNTVKKHEQVSIKLGMLNPFYYLMVATNEKISVTQIQGGVPQMPIFDKKEREDFVKDWIVPKEEFKEYVLRWGDPDYRFPEHPSMQLICEYVDWQESLHYVDNATGVCGGISSRILKPVFHLSNFPLFISAATGVDMDEAELTKILKRNRTLLRAVNVRKGLRRADERPPEDHWKSRFPEYEAELHDKYYEFKGWNKEGIPTRETLRELDLDYVGEDLEQRGVYEE